jgi:hypothetical protein
MSERKKSYCIIKKMTLRSGVPQHVILVDGESEIREWDNKEDADGVAELFNANTDSGYEYVVREI